MSARLSRIAERRVVQTVDRRLTAFPVVVLAGARAVGKSMLLRDVANRRGVPIIDIDDLDTRALAAADPAGFVTGPAPVCIDEFQHVPPLLDAIKAELNQRSEPGRFIITGSTRYEALPRAAQSLTGRVTVVPVWPLSQGEIDGRPETLVERLVAGDVDAPGFSGGVTDRSEYIDRVLAGGFPQPLVLLPQMRDQWFADYVALVCDRDVLALSKIRQREELPRLLTQLSHQTAQLLNVSEAAKRVGLDKSTAENYTRLLEAVFLLHRLPAWGTGLGSKAGASPKLHLVDTGIAGVLTNVTAENLANRRTAALTTYGHVFETFVVNEILKQVSWLSTRVATGHWRDRSGAEVDLVLERSDAGVIGIEIKSGSQVQSGDAKGLRALADRLDDRWIGGVVFYTGRHAATLDADRKVIALPTDALWV